MTAPINPTDYNVEVFPLGQSGALSTDEWLLWTGSPVADLTVQFTNGLPVRSLWFPNPGGQALLFYAGATATGTPFYTTDGSVPELVTIPNDAPVVTVTTTGGLPPSPALYVFASTYAYPPFRGTAPPPLNIQVTAPIVNTGSPSAPVIGIQNPLPVADGGTGTAAPSLIAGANITITGSWPNQTVAAVTGAGGVQSVTAGTGINITGSAANPVVNLITPLALNLGGTFSTNPFLGADSSGILVNGGTADDSSFQWTLSLGNFLKDNGGTFVTGPAQLLQNGGVTVTHSGAHAIIIDTTALIPVTGGLTSTGGTIDITPHAGSQSVNIEADISIFPVYQPDGSKLSGTPHIVINPPGTPVAVSWSVTGGTVTVGSQTVTLTGAARFSSSSSYTVVCSIHSVTGSSAPAFVMSASPLSGTQFTISGYGLDPGATSSGNVNIDYICIGN